MAMIKKFVVRDCHAKAITAMAYASWRREYVTGSEDGQLRYWELDSGKMTHSVQGHAGWIADIQCWNEAKVMFTGSNDGTIVLWTSTGTVHQKLTLGVPVYSLVWQPKKAQLIAGLNGCIRVYEIIESNSVGIPSLERKGVTLTAHVDIVKCVVSVEGKIYSGGFDQRLVIYDCPPGERKLEITHIIKGAHEAGISCMAYSRDTENTWILTGSFDYQVKLWTPEGKLVHKITDAAGSTVTGLCYLPRSKIIWIAGGSESLQTYEPKSGENVSDFMSTYRELIKDSERFSLTMLKYIPDTNEVMASTKRRQVVVWKHEQSAAVITLQCKNPPECLDYTSKVPILIFSGNSDGQVIKWERQQLNNFTYSQENYTLSDVRLTLGFDIDNTDTGFSSDGEESPDSDDVNSTSRLDQKKGERHLGDPSVSLLKALYAECLDLLIVSSENGNIYVWGYDEAAKKALSEMKPSASEVELIKKYSAVLTESSTLLNPKKNLDAAEDSVTDRVAGFVCKYVLRQHSGCVTGLALVEDQDSVYLISGGWDQTVCLWDLPKGNLATRLRCSRPEGTREGMEGVITDLAYSSSRNEFAYSSSDKMIYVRKFSKRAAEMRITSVLEGHEGEVLQVKWNEHRQCWVTGSEDGTIRLWKGDGSQCEAILGASGNVTALCIDKKNGCIVAGVDDNLRVYDPVCCKLLQTNAGHMDSIRCIIHISERNQYVSASWDRTIRIWNAYVKRKKGQEDDDQR
ncbi:uncharacterized WD repeat-containing protein alr3466-like [Oscarella lobularis]|uniref:uncharacterized WD repeat-containing protein alr3466-like n=1 Tax=Oscarella lobularis TaxID=121494 RepID=UPI003313E6CC